MARVPKDGHSRPSPQKSGLGLKRNAAQQRDSHIPYDHVSMA